MKTLLTLSEFARRAGISRPTARLYADSGIVPCYHDTRGGRLFLESAVEQARAAKESRVHRRVAEGG
jgi:DNA-binding transcriptional MerR regulator